MTTSSKRILFLGLVACLATIVAAPESLVPAQVEPCGLRYIDYDCMVQAIVSRTNQFDNQKYVQAGIVGSATVLACFAWKYWPKSEAEADGAEGQADVSTPLPRTKKKKGFIKKWFNHATSTLTISFITIFAGVLAQQLSSDVLVTGRKLLRNLWFGANNCLMFESLAILSLKSYDCLLLRRQEHLSLADEALVKRYNQFIGALERYVTELAADILHLSKKRHIPCDGVDQLLAQFVCDVAAVNSKLLELETPLLGEETRGRNLCCMVLETIGQLKDLHARLSTDFDQTQAGQTRDVSLF